MPSPKQSVKGYRTRTLDGNHLGKTNHRLKVLRNTKAGALPGKALVLLDPQRMLIDEVVLCEDGHAQECSLLDQFMPLLAKNDLLIADRNFSTLGDTAFVAKAPGPDKKWFHRSRTLAGHPSREEWNR